MGRCFSTHPLRSTTTGGILIVRMVRSVLAESNEGQSPGIVAAKFIVQLSESLGIADPNLQRLVTALIVILAIMAIIMVTLILHRCYAVLFRDDYRNIRRFELPLPINSYRHSDRSHEPLSSPKFSKRKRNRLQNRTEGLRLANGGITTGPSCGQHFLSPSADNSLINVTSAQVQQTRSSFHSMFGDSEAGRGDEQMGMMQEGSDASEAGAFSRPHYPSLDIIVN